MTAPATLEPAPGGARGPGAETDRDDVFVSYAREERHFVASVLLPALRGRGKQVWVDLEDIPPAADWRGRVMAGIEGTKAFVLVLSPNSLASSVCAEELAHAVELHKRIVPVLHREVETERVPSELAAPNWILLRASDNEAQGIADLIEALETDLQWRDAHARLTVRGQEWQGARRDRSFLLRGSDLRAAEDWLAQQEGHAETPTPTQVSYIMESRRAAARRQRVTLAAVATGLVIAVVLAVVALLQRQEAVRQAHTAQSRELAALATSQLEADPELSLLLSAKGARIAPTIQSTTALRMALSASHISAVLRLPADPTGPPDASRDGRLVVQAGSDRVARVFERGNETRPTELRGHRNPNPSYPDYASGTLALSAALSPDGRFVATTGDDGLLKIWDWRRGDSIATLRPRLGALGDVRFSPDGRWLASASRAESPIVLIWDWRRRRVVRRLSGITGSIERVSFDPTGRHVAAAGLEGTVKVWERASGRALATLQTAASTYLRDVAFSGDGVLIVTADGDATTEVWDWRHRRRLSQLRGGGSDGSAAFGPGDRTLVTAGSDGRARVWDWVAGRTIAELRGHRGAIVGVKVLTGGQVLTSATDRTVRRWTLGPGGFALPQRGGVEAQDIAFGPDGRRLIASGPQWSHSDPSRVAQIWDLATRRVLASLPEAPVGNGDHAPWLHVAFSPDGRFVAGASDSGLLHVWDWRSGQEHPVFRLGGVFAGGAAFNADGSLLATSDSTRSLIVWRWRDRRLLARLRARGPTPLATFPRAVAFYPQDAHIVAATDGDAVRIWDWRRRRQVARLTLPAAAIDVKFSADGSHLAAAGGDGVARVWDWRRDDVRAEVRAAGPLSSVDLSPNGDLLLTADADGAATVWDWAAEQKIAEFREPTERRLKVNPGTQAARFSPDGRNIATAGIDNRVHIYRCEPCAPPTELLNLVGRRTTRSLTTAERKRYSDTSGPE